MVTFSTRAAAKKLGIAEASLSKYIRLKRIPAPRAVTSGGMTIHLWTEAEIEHVRQLLPKIANGRKTRYKKQSAKTKAQPKAKSAVPRKKKPKKK
jgi:hypothetical protein